MNTCVFNDATVCKDSTAYGALTTKQAMPTRAPVRADNATYGSCVAAPSCRNPVPVPRPNNRDIQGTVFPGLSDATNEPLLRLVDGQTSTASATVGYGMRTTSTSPQPYVTIDLGAPYDDIGGVSVWPWTDTIANIGLGQNLSIWLHSNANFSSDSAATLCASGIRAKTFFETYTHCPSRTGVRYVTGVLGYLPSLECETSFRQLHCS